MTAKKHIPENLLPYFSEIAKRLWTGHATVMVGSGFSKNAKNNGASKNFPDWNQLGDIFFEKLYAKKHYNEDEVNRQKKYLNILKLADEVQAAFGRSTLNQIIKSEIPDMEYQPSILHKELMQLPWSDVFTTNYDTLLERASESILDQKFDVVVNKEDLVYAAKPRIIKLHGSFPSERPFIISEDDYRRYPKEFAPFVNTVQQSLLENTLCLIGFSGDDPNFLQWIGWIRDNLGKENAPKIYLIGILDFSEAQKRLLEQRNIIPLDLSSCKGINKDHGKALSLFLKYLIEDGKSEGNLDWPKDNERFSLNREKDVTPQVIPIIEHWKSVRKQYPNWLILPSKRREVLREDTENIIPFVFRLSEVESPTDIQFLYEYNWRIEKYLMPIYSDSIEYYEKVINKYNPFPNLIQIEGSEIHFEKNDGNINRNEITVYWLEIQLSMMRFYREEGFHEKWIFITERLKKLYENFVPELKARFHYECCLYYLFALDISKVRNELSSWKINNSLPYWEAKKAGVLGEIGDVVESEKILETSLITIRREINLSPIESDYSNVSQEAYIMQLSRYMKNSVSFLNGTFSISPDINKEYSKRWNTLIQYKCDPWAELESFNSLLDRKPKESKEKEEKYSFDIGRVSIMHHWGGSNNIAAKAYGYLRYQEETGIPHVLPGITFGTKTAHSAINLISKYSPYWAFASSVRTGDAKIIESIFNRNSISKYERKVVDALIEEYLSVLDKSKNEIEKGNVFHSTGFTTSLSTVIPEIISRLCVKSSHDIKIKLITFLNDAHSIRLKGKFKGIGNLTKRLIGSLSISNQHQVVALLLEFPILEDSENSIPDDYIDPILLVKKNDKTLKIELNQSIIKSLIGTAKQHTVERKYALRRLLKLYELKYLTQSQTKQLGDILWNRVDEVKGFPIDTDFYYFAFINLPHPTTVNPEQLLRNYISTSSFPIQSNRKEKGISMLGYRNELSNEILGSANTDIIYTWNKKEISLLIEKSIAWWDGDKKFLKGKEPAGYGSIPDEFIKIFNNLVSIYSKVFGSKYKLINKKQSQELYRIIIECEENGINTNQALASCYYLFPQVQEYIKSKIYLSLFSKSEAKVGDALNAIDELLKLEIDEAQNLVKTISEQIRSRYEIELSSFVRAITSVIKNYPTLINDEVLSNLEIGLTNLITETEIHLEDSDKKVDTKLTIKKSTAHLTIALTDYFNTKQKKIPDYVNEWKRICLDKNEFSEIRRIWENV